MRTVYDVIYYAITDFIKDKLVVYAYYGMIGSNNILDVLAYKIWIKWL